MEDIRMSIKDYKESLIGGLFDEKEIREEIRELEQAKVGQIKGGCWEKISDTEIILFTM